MERRRCPDSDRAGTSGSFVATCPTAALARPAVNAAAVRPECPRNSRRLDRIRYLLDLLIVNWQSDTNDQFTPDSIGEQHLNGRAFVRAVSLPTFHRYLTGSIALGTGS